MLNQALHSSFFPFLLLIFSCTPFLCNAQSNKTTQEKINALQEKSNYKENTEYIDLLYKLALEKSQSNLDSMYVLINEGLKLSLNSDYIKGEGYAYMRFGSYYSLITENEKAIDYHEQSIAFAELHNLEKLKVITLNNHGILLSNMGDNAKALTLFLEAIDVCKKIEFNGLLSVLYSNVGGMYSELDDPETALEFIQKAKDINEKLGHEEWIMRTLSNMAYEHIRLKNYNTAQKNLELAIPYFEKNNHNRWLGHAYRVQGLIAFEKKDYQTALEWFKKSKELLQAFSDFYEISYALDGMANSYLKLKQYDKAKAAALEAKSLAEDSNLLVGLMMSTHVLNKVSKIEGNYEKAWHYQKEYLEHYKKHNAENYSTSIAMVKNEMAFENEKHLLVEENDKALAKQRNLLSLIASGLALLLIILFFVYIDYTKQKKFNLVLQERELELNNSIKTKNKLFSIIAHDLKGPITSVFEVMKMYAKGLITPEDSKLLFPKAIENIGAVSDMLDNLLAWGRTQIKGSQITPTNVDLTYYVNKNMALLKPSADKKSIKLRHSIDPDFFCYCDKDHIDIVLRNLISNAIKFTQTNGAIEISAIHKENEIRIAVKDNGVGMELQKLGQVFDDKTMNSTYGTHNEKGTGLGLPLCKELVQKNMGKILANSILNKGTTMYFTVPERRILELAV